LGLGPSDRTALTLLQALCSAVGDPQALRANEHDVTITNVNNVLSMPVIRRAPRSRFENIRKA
jgi:hypothetical protein